MIARFDAVAKKRKKKQTFDAAKQARLRAREAIGAPRPTRAVPAKKHKPPKHKKKLLEQELDEL